VDANATAKYIEKAVTGAVDGANKARANYADLLRLPLNVGSSMSSPHVLDAVTHAEAVALSFLEIHDVANGTLEQVGTEKFLEATETVRKRILDWLRTSRVENGGIVQVQANARHNAATRVLSVTDIIELIDEED
jgi:hypothetical protein